MALTESQLLAMLDSLKSAYYSGALEVVGSDGKKVRFDSRAEMKARIRELSQELGLTGSRRKQVSYISPRSDEV